MNEYFMQQPILNVTLGHLATETCTAEPAVLIWLEQWRSSNDFISSCVDECERTKLISELINGQHFTVHPSSGKGFSIVNILGPP